MARRNGPWAIATGLALTLGCSSESSPSTTTPPSAGGSSSGSAAGGSTGAASLGGAAGSDTSRGGASGSGGVTGSAGASAGSPGNGSGAAGAAGSAGTSDGSGGEAGSPSEPDDGDCNTPPPPSPLIGWASEGDGTTGGGNQPPVVVTSASELTSALKGDSAKVIYLRGNVEGSFAITSHTTLVGVCGAKIKGHLGISGASNVIVRNLKLVGNDCADSPEDCSDGADAMTLGKAAHHVWIDHLDISDGSDGNLDITQGSDFVTVSWTKFSYSSKRSDPEAGASGHRFSNLIGSSDTEPADVGHLNVTYHHCWWAENVDQRMPRSRRGQIHVFNNLYTASGNNYCTNAGQDAKLLVQNNVYAGVKNPLQITANGNMKSEGNDFTGSSGDQDASGSGFVPPYDFELDETATLRSALEAGVGPHD